MTAATKVVQLLAAVCTVVFIGLLFLNEPEPVEPAAAPEDGGTTVVGAAVDGAAVYGQSCAGCHGADGGGGRGPQLSEGAVVEAFPEVDDEIGVVTLGRGGMPAFGSRLTPAEIEAVVEFTRTL